MILKDMHFSYACMERFSFQFLTQFYKKLKDFREASQKNSFIDGLAAFLNNQKYNRNPVKDLSRLSLRDQQIAQAAFAKFSEHGDFLIHWKSLVIRLIQRVQDKVITDFALHFLEPVSEMIQDLNKRSDLQVAHLIKELHHVTERDSEAPVHVLLENTFRKLFSEKQEDTTKKIKEMFEAQQPSWESYLDISGQGIVKYLSELLGIKIGIIA